MILKTPFCQELSKNEPEFANSLRRCTPQDFCEDHLTQEIDFLESCPKGLFEGSKEQLTEWKNLAVDYGKSVADRTREQNRKINEECNQNIECKRSLVLGNPKYQNISDEDLNKFTAAFLFVEKQNDDYIQSTQKRHQLPDPVVSQRLAQQSEAHRQVSSTRNPQFSSVFKQAAEWLHYKGARLECLNQKTKAELICWGASYILLPGVVAKGAVKGIAGAKYVAKLAKQKVLPSSVKAVAALSRNVGIQEGIAIEKAHRIGRGEAGADGTPARVGNYTRQQIREKARKLKEAGVGKSDRRKLMENGVVGDNNWLETAIKLDGDLENFGTVSWKMKNGPQLQSEIEKLREELLAALDNPATAESKIAEIKQKLEQLRKANQQVATSSAELKAVTTSENLQSAKTIHANELILLKSQASYPRYVQFTEGALKDFTKAEESVSKKLLESLKHGAQNESLDQSKLRIMSGMDDGPKGRPFEVVIIHHGHQRLFGCFRNGIFTIMKYDPHAPEVKSGTIKKYNDLCK